MKTSPNIKTHYTIPAGPSSERRIVTKSNGGSSVRVLNMDDGSQPLLEIYLTTNLPKRQCALVSKLAAQLVEELDIHPIDIISGVSQLLLVPHLALDELLIENGVIGKSTTKTNIEEIWIPGEAIRDSQIGNRVQPEVEDPNSSTHSRLSSNLVVQKSRSMSTISSTEIAEEATTHLRRTRNQVSVLRASNSSDHIRVLSERQMARNSLEEPAETMPLEPVTTAEIYNAFNRSRNINRLRDFARITETILSVRGQRNRPRMNIRGSVFDLNELELALQETDPVLSPVIPMAVRPNHHRIGGISDRTPDQRARDFEVGFLGEYFVSSFIHNRSDTRC